MELNAGTYAAGRACRRQLRGGSGAAKISGLTELMAGVPAAAAVPRRQHPARRRRQRRPRRQEGRRPDRRRRLSARAAARGDATVDAGGAREVAVRRQSGRSRSNDVFADPQRLNPGNIRIVPRHRDRSAESGPTSTRRSFTVPARRIRDHGPRRRHASRSRTCRRSARTCRPSDGSDKLRHIELLQFADITIIAAGDAAPVTVTVPNVVGQPLTAAQATLHGRGPRQHTWRRTRARSSRSAASSAQVPPAGAHVARGTPVA